MIGLKRHTVRLSEHNKAWVELADSVCSEIKHAANHLIADVQHIGSTSVPGLLAKPIIDIAVGVRDLKFIDELVPIITGLGYIYRGDNKVNGGHLFVFETSPEVRSIHVHVVEHNGNQWHNYLLFRDTLRSDKATREKYANLKADLCKRYPGDRQAYTFAKKDLIGRILKTATQQSD